MPPKRKRVKKAISAQIKLETFDPGLEVTPSSRKKLRTDNKKKLSLLHAVTNSESPSDVLNSAESVGDKVSSEQFTLNVQPVPKLAFSRSKKDRKSSETQDNSTNTNSSVDPSLINGIQENGIEPMKRIGKHKKQQDVSNGETQKAKAEKVVNLSKAPKPSNVKSANKKLPKGVIQELAVQVPLAETPMIRKNQDMRKGRQSLNNRGRRSSSFGSESLKPHPDIRTESFYRHISAELPLPVRMRQLLLWCGSRFLDEKKELRIRKGKEKISPLGDIETLAIELIEALIRALCEKKLDISWLRESNTVNAKTKDLTSSNVNNNHDLIYRQELSNLEEIIADLKIEDDQWTALEESTNQKHQDLNGIISLPPPPLSALLDETLIEPDIWECVKNRELDDDKSGATTITEEMDRFITLMHSLQNCIRNGESYSSVIARELVKFIQPTGNQNDLKSALQALSRKPS